MVSRKQVTILYTNRVAVAGTLELADEIRRDCRVVSIIGDSLLGEVLAAGKLTLDVTRRVVQYCVAAEDGGADIILS